MKIGIKVGPQTERSHIELMKNKMDHIEIYAKIGYDVDFLDFNKEIIIHIPHYGEGLNICNPDKWNFNSKAWNYAIKLADKYNSKKIVFHSGVIENDKCTMDVAKKFVKEHFDKRLLAETLPATTMGFWHLAKNYEEIREIMATGVGICVDFSHAFEAAIRERKNPVKVVEKYLDLGPKYFHLTDTNTDLVFDSEFNELHLNFGEGNLNLDLIKKLIPNDGQITLETPQTEKQVQEIEFLKR